MEEFDPMYEPKNMAAGDVAPSGESVDVHVVPVAAATAKIEQDIFPLAMASTSLPEEPLEGAVVPVVEEADSSFSEPLSVKIEEEARVEELVEAVSSSTPLASGPSPVVEVAEAEGPVEVAEVESPVEVAEVEAPAEVEEVEGEPIAALHLSGYFFSLEDRVPTSLLALIYWRQPLKSGVVFSSLFFLLLAFSLFSFVTVVAHLALLALGLTSSYVLFKKVAASVQKTGEGHPFQELLDRDVRTILSADDLNDYIKAIMDDLVHVVEVLRGLFLIVNLFDSIKLAVFLWGMTYVGEMFNLLTIFIIALVLLFTVPKTYEVYGADMDIIADKLMAQAKAQWPVIQEQVVDRLMMIKERVIAAVPIGKEKSS